MNQMLINIIIIKKGENICSETIHFVLFILVYVHLGSGCV